MQKCQFKFAYVVSTVTKFRFRFYSYKITHGKFRTRLKNGIIQEIKNKNCFMNIIIQVGMRVLQTGASS